MSLSLATRQAYSEIDEFLSLLSEKQREEIPQKLRDYFKEEKDKSYQKEIKNNIPISEQDLKEETLAIIAILNLNYWCKDESEKQRLKSIYSENEKKYQERINEKFDSSSLFKNNKNGDINKEIEGDNSKTNLPAELEKETFFKKILKIIRKMFNKSE